MNATPGQEAAADPTTTAYRVHAHAFNMLTTMLAADDRFVPLSVREAVAGAIVEAIEPLIRADERAVAAKEPQAAPVVTFGAPAGRRLSLGPCPSHPGSVHAQILDEPFDGTEVWACLRALADIAESASTEITVRDATPAPDPAAALGDWPAILADVTQQRDDLRELLDQVGVLAANAPEDDGSFAVCEQIAMRIAAAGVPDTTPIDEWPAPDREQFIAAAEEHLAARRPRPADTAEQPAPVVAAAMRESRLYREALHRAQEALDEDGTIGRRLSVARSIVKAALEGK